MRSDPADPGSQAGHPRRRVTGLVVFVLVVVVAIAAGVISVVRRPESAVLPASPTSDGTAARPGVPARADVRADAAAALLGRLVTALRPGSDRPLAALAAPGDRAARRELMTLRANVRALRIADLAMRYVDEDDGRLDPSRQRRLGDRGWVADVQLTWALRGWDRRDSHLEVTITFVQTPHGARFVTARDDYGQAAPLWMLTRVRARHTGRALVVGAGTAAVDRYISLADQAVLDVRKVLHRWRGRLVVEVPAGPDELARVLNASPGSYSGIAAVTTTVDGSSTVGAPTHIFVNRPVFDPLGPEGSQIVMSHEATHVATRAATSTMPTWLLEGFADFVALDHVDLPVSVTASQILAEVRKDGAPRSLPGADDFDPQNKALGASYEAAWLACRLLAQKYGERRLITFYRASDRAGSTAGPFREVLGTNEAAFTKAWRADLQRLS